MVWNSLPGFLKKVPLNCNVECCEEAMVRDIKKHDAQCNTEEFVNR